MKSRSLGGCPNTHRHQQSSNNRQHKSSSKVTLLSPPRDKSCLAVHIADPRHTKQKQQPPTQTLQKINTKINESVSAPEKWGPVSAPKRVLPVSRTDPRFCPHHERIPPRYGTSCPPTPVTPARRRRLNHHTTTGILPAAAAARRKTVLIWVSSHCHKQPLVCTLRHTAGAEVRRRRDDADRKRECLRLVWGERTGLKISKFTNGRTLCTSRQCSRLAG